MLRKSPVSPRNRDADGGTQINWFLLSAVMLHSLSITSTRTSSALLASSSRSPSITNESPSLYHLNPLVKF